MSGPMDKVFDKYIVIVRKVYGEPFCSTGEPVGRDSGGDGRGTGQREASQEQEARQSRLVMEADGPANTKTRERTEGAAIAVQAMHGDSFSACRVDPGPKTNSTSFGMMAEPPDLPCREDVLIEDSAAASKSCLPSLEMRSPTAAVGLLPIGEASTAIKTTFNKSPLRFYSNEATNPKETHLWTSVLSSWYDSSFWRNKLLAAPSCRRVIETNSMQSRTFDPGGFKVVSAPARFLDRGACCFVVRLCKWERLVMSCSVFRRKRVVPYIRHVWQSIVFSPIRRVKKKVLPSRTARAEGTNGGHAVDDGSR